MTLPFDQADFVWGAAGLPGTGITTGEKNTINSRLTALEGETIPSVLNDLSNVSGTPSTGNLLRYDGSGWVPYDLPDITIQTAIEFVIDGGGSTIATGIKGDFRLPYTFTPTEWAIFADQNGAIQIDVWKDNYTNFPPVDADSVTASAPLAIPATTNKWASTALTGWNTTWAEDDIIRINVDSVTNIQRCTVVIYGNRTIPL